MSNELEPKPNAGQPVVYQIRIKGYLGSQWSDWFEGMTITPAEDGNTLLTGRVIDQAMLYGLLKKIRDLGMPLVSVRPLESRALNPSDFQRRPKMKTNLKTTVTKDRKLVLSTLWIYALFNYLYADVFTLFFNSTAQKETFAMPQESVLVFAVLMEIAIAMVFLSRFLNYDANRWANIIAGIVQTALVTWSLTGQTPLPFTIFFSGIEIVCTLFIVWYAWMWKPAMEPDSKNGMQ